MTVISLVALESQKKMYLVYFIDFCVIPSGFQAPWSTNKGQRVLEWNVIPSAGVQYLLVQ